MHRVIDYEIDFMCDREACKKCVTTCSRTSDIRHAVNFKQNASGVYTEMSNKEKENRAFTRGLQASGRML